MSFLTAQEAVKHLKAPNAKNYLKKKRQEGQTIKAVPEGVFLSKDGMLTFEEARNIQAPHGHQGRKVNSLKELLASQSEV